MGLASTAARTTTDGRRRATDDGVVVVIAAVVVDARARATGRMTLRSIVSLRVVPRARLAQTHKT
jgi:hypothetical protein